jgi:dUTP pyrophosphatase
MQVKIQRLSKSVPVPAKATKDAAGFDLSSSIDVVIAPNTWTLVPTGLKVAIDPGYEMQIRSRSGLAYKKGVVVLNSPGTIDADYRGEVGVILFNNGENDFVIARGDRIAQAVIAMVPEVNFVEVDSLDETDRGEGGFGSTGVK